MLFPIDHGNSAMKTVNFVFPSGLIDNPIRPPVDTEMLEYDGKFWTLSGQRISYMRDKTKDERYWILTLFAIAKELEKSGNTCLLYTSPSPRDRTRSRMPSSA